MHPSINLFGSLVITQHLQKLITFCLEKISPSKVVLLFSAMQDRRHYLMPWGTLGAVEAFLFGSAFAIFGMNDLNAADFIIAKMLFLVGCLLLVFQAILFAARRPALMSYLLAFVLSGALGVAGLMLVNYVNQKRDAKLVKPTSSEQTSNTAPTPTPSPAPSLKENPPAPDEKKLEPTPSSDRQRTEKPRTPRQQRKISPPDDGADILSGKKKGPTVN